jgi:hypothetical protein
MFLVLASRYDAPARALVERWNAAGKETALMTCLDLALAGWKVELGGEKAPWRGIVGAQVIAPADVKAVVNRLPAVTLREVDFIRPEDRVFAATEMQAFLLAWLAGLECPVLNRPTATGLNGPTWAVEQWTRAAADAELPTRTVRRRAVLEEAEAPAPASDATLVTAHVVGTQALGDADAKTRKAAVKMAAAAGVDLLRVHFEPAKKGPDVFIHADYWVDVTQPEIADALLERCAS